MKNSITELTFKDFESLKNTIEKIKEKPNSNIDLEHEFLLLSIIIKKYGVKFLRNINKISFRIALLAVLEEQVVETKISNREQYEYDNIYRKANNRYKLSNRNKKRFPSLKDIHPEDPFIWFEDSNYLMKNYFNAINTVLIGRLWILENDKAYESLNKIYTEIKDAYQF